MTIFDALKYPISIPPTLEQLEALPTDLYKEWIDHHTLDWYKQGADIRYNPLNVSQWMSNMCRHKDPELDTAKQEIAKDISTLRKLIHERE